MTWLGDQFRTFRAILVWWRERLTLTGKAIAVCMVCCLPYLPDMRVPAIFFSSGFSR
jgi:hypothetical protein